MVIKYLVVVVVVVVESFLNGKISDKTYVALI